MKPLGYSRPSVPVLRREDGSRLSGVDDDIDFISSSEIEADGSVERALGVAQQNAPRIMDDLVRTSLNDVLPAETRIKAAGLVLSYGLGLPSRGQTLEARKLSTKRLREEMDKFVKSIAVKETDDE